MHPGVAIYLQMLELGLHGTPSDLVVDWGQLVPWTDALIELSLPEGGVVAIGESHRQPGTHNFVKELMRESEVVDCVLLEHPAWHQHWIAAFVQGAPCEESWGLAEELALGADGPVCRRDLRHRMLQVASRTATAVFAVDACYSCEPLVSVLPPGRDVVEGLSPEAFGRWVLGYRNAFMADAIADLFAEGRCTHAVLLTGRAHVAAPDGFTVEPVAGVGDELRARGVPTVDWPTFDVHGEVHDVRWWAPETARFVLGPAGVAALFLE